MTGRRAAATDVARAAGLAVAAAVVAPAAPAWALCPNCLGQTPAVPPTMQLVGLFLLVPPAVFLAVVFAIRRLGRQSVAAPPSSGGGDQAG